MESHNKLTVLKKIKQAAPGHVSLGEKILAIWKVLTPWASHKKRQMSYPQKQLLGEPLLLKPAGLPAIS